MCMPFGGMRQGEHEPLFYIIRHLHRLSYSISFPGFTFCYLSIRLRQDRHAFLDSSSLPISLLLYTPYLHLQRSLCSRVHRAVYTVNPNHPRVLTNEQKNQE